ncbi:hypothetical protein K491DRAFT_782544 [Lophiostoma macrostomum CBS 122681]|uniref:Cyanovirin-N domain-containing protein n=1 Tax=Lophiostoma macrostomum CBS 122681 TaxID=1314788 RepID=A0A6A6SVP5_9PLEO|nr:hypothetical protein K491DRAFT_782544 [Lophiostoma macrostomum CBS 122681]
MYFTSQSMFAFAAAILTLHPAASVPLSTPELAIAIKHSRRHVYGLSIDLNQCYVNAGNQLMYRFNGGAFNSCKDCEMDGSLKITCNCGGPKVWSSIDLDSTNGNNAKGWGVFVTTDANINCRAPP